MQMGGTATLTGVTVIGTGEDPGLGGGVGVFADDTNGAGHLVLSDSVIGAHPIAAVWLDGPGAYELRGNELTGGEGLALTPELTVHGNAVFVSGGVGSWDGQQGLLLEANTIEGSAWGILLHGSSAQLAGNDYSGNAVDLVQQACDGVETPAGFEEAPTAQLCSGYDQVTVELTFTVYLQESETL